jgi:steroid delta-isomerase-like uncharacterized protein
VPDAGATVRALVDAWNSHDVERICAFFHDDFENYQAPLPPVVGLDAYRHHLTEWFSAYPDLRLEIVSLFAESDRVCLETRARGTPARAFFGVEAAYGRDNRALDVLELRDGRVLRQRGYWDFSVWTGAPSPLVTAANRKGGPTKAMLIYIEFISRRDGVGLEQFHKVAGRGQEGWAGDYPDDLMVVNLGRTWRTGPGPEYMCAWYTPKQGLDRIDDWEKVFRSSAADAFEEPFRLAARIDRAGCYEPLLEPVVGTAERYYAEYFDFAPDASQDDVRAAYEDRRARHTDLQLNLLCDRIGRLAPDPRGLAIWGIPDWGAVATIAEELGAGEGPVRLADAGLYSWMGKETL